MNVPVVCGCQKRFYVHADFAGRSVPCPFCGTMIDVAADVEQAHVAPSHEPPAAPDSGSPTGEPRANPRVLSNALAVTASLLATIAAGMKPAAPVHWNAALAVAGLGFAALGLLLSITGRRDGASASIVSLLFCGTIALQAARHASTLAKQAAGQPHAQPSSNASTTARINPPSDGDPLVVRHGDFLVKILSARLEHPRVRALYFDEITEWPTPALILHIEVRNLGKSAVREYQPSGGRVVDDFGNRYDELDLGTSSLAERSLAAHRLYPGAVIRDLLVFEPPVERARMLEVELPGATVGGEESFRFRLRSAQVEGFSP